MKFKLLSLVALSTLAVACGKKDAMNENKNAESMKQVASASMEKPLPSVKSLSSNVFVADRVFFRFDDATVEGRYSADLKAQAAYIKTKLLSNPNAMVVVEGNCDERGGVEYNIALGHKRANAAKNVLIAEGVPADKIKTTSFGKERKLVEGTSAVAYLQNRAAVTKVQE